MNNEWHQGFQNNMYLLPLNNNNNNNWLETPTPTITPTLVQSQRTTNSAYQQKLASYLYAFHPVVLGVPVVLTQ